MIPDLMQSDPFVLGIIAAVSVALWIATRVLDGLNR